MTIYPGTPTYGVRGTVIMLIGTLISLIPLMIYIAFYDKEDDGAWIGTIGCSIINILRKIKNVV